MKRLLNLNPHADALLKAAVEAVVILPALLHALQWLPATGPLARLRPLSALSVPVGAAALLVLVLIVAIEQVQDALFDRRYRRQRSHRLPTGDGHFECQYCGNMRLTEQERRCPVCGAELF